MKFARIGEYVDNRASHSRPSVSIDIWTDESSGSEVRFPYQNIMRLPLLFITLIICAVAANAQTRPIAEADYEELLSYAVSETNADFPFVFTVTTEFIENGKPVRTVAERNEREAQLRERTTRTTTIGDKIETQFQISAGSGNTFCSEDGKTWTNRSGYMCFGPVNFYGREHPLSIERTISEESENGKTLRVLREYTILPPENKNGKNRFREEVSTIDERGFFVSIITTEGTLEPRTTILIRKQEWTKVKFDPVKPPQTK